MKRGKSMLTAQFKDILVINGHGSKSDSTFDIRDNVMLTPHELTTPYTFSVDYEMGILMKKGKLKPVKNGQWNAYSKQSSAVPNVNVFPWKDNEVFEFASRIAIDTNLWSEIDGVKGLYFDRDPDLRLVILTHKGTYEYLDRDAAKGFFKNINNKIKSDGKPLFLYAPKVGKVKPFNETSVREILTCINQFAGKKIVVLATCNAISEQDKEVSLSIDSAEDIDISSLLPQAQVEQPKQNNIEKYFDSASVKNLYHMALKNGIIIADGLELGKRLQRLIYDIFLKDNIQFEIEKIIVKANDQNGFNVSMPKEYHLALSKIIKADEMAKSEVVSKLAVAQPVVIQPSVSQPVVAVKPIAIQSSVPQPVVAQSIAISQPAVIPQPVVTVKPIAISQPVIAAQSISISQPAAMLFQVKPQLLQFNVEKWLNREYTLMLYNHAKDAGINVLNNQDGRIRLQKLIYDILLQKKIEVDINHIQIKYHEYDGYDVVMPKNLHKSLAMVMQADVAEKWLNKEWTLKIYNHVKGTDINVLNNEDGRIRLQKLIYDILMKNNMIEIDINHIQVEYHEYDGYEVTMPKIFHEKLANVVKSAQQSIKP